MNHEELEVIQSRTGCKKPCDYLEQRCKKRQMRQIYLCYFFQLVLTFEPFWVIFGPFRQFWVIFGPIWALLGHFWAILGNFRSFLGHFFGANLLWQNMPLCYLNRFLQLWPVLESFHK